LTGERQHRDRALAGVAREQRRTVGAFGQPAARVIEPLAHVEHRGLHVGAPREVDGVIASPFRLTSELDEPGVAAIASSTGSATNRDTSSARRPCRASGS
jgi:hypothetical protein